MFSICDIFFFFLNITKPKPDYPAPQVSLWCSDIQVQLLAQSMSIKHCKRGRAGLPFIHCLCFRMKTVSSALTFSVWQLIVLSRTSKKSIVGMHNSTLGCITNQLKSVNQQAINKYDKKWSNMTKANVFFFFFNRSLLA